MATTTDEPDDEIGRLASSMGCEIYEAREDVLGRFLARRRTAIRARWSD